MRTMVSAAGLRKVPKMSDSTVRNAAVLTVMTLLIVSWLTCFNVRDAANPWKLARLKKVETMDIVDRAHEAMFGNHAKYHLGFGERWLKTLVARLILL